MDYIEITESEIWFAPDPELNFYRVRDWDANEVSLTFSELQHIYIEACIARRKSR